MDKYAPDQQIVSRPEQPITNIDSILHTENNSIDEFSGETINQEKRKTSNRKSLDFDNLKDKLLPVYKILYTIPNWILKTLRMLLKYYSKVMRI